MTKVSARVLLISMATVAGTTGIAATAGADLLIAGTACAASSLAALVTAARDSTVLTALIHSRADERRLRLLLEAVERLPSEQIDAVKHLLEAGHGALHR